MAGEVVSQTSADAGEIDAGFDGISLPADDDRGRSSHDIGMAAADKGLVRRALNPVPPSPGQDAAQASVGAVLAASEEGSVGGDAVTSTATQNTPIGLPGTIGLPATEEGVACPRNSVAQARRDHRTIRRHGSAWEEKIRPDDVALAAQDRRCQAPRGIVSATQDRRGISIHLIPQTAPQEGVVGVGSDHVVLTADQRAAIGVIGVAVAPHRSPSRRCPDPLCCCAHP